VNATRHAVVVAVADVNDDRVVEQADYLSRNDTDGYEQVFGKL